MAEIGLAASVIAVIQITAAVTTQAYNYGRDVKNAKQDLEDINRELKELEGILSKLEDLAQQAKVSGQTLESWPALASLGDGRLKEWEIVLTRLKGQLAPVNGTWAKLVEPVRWARKKRKAVKSLGDVLKQKNAYIESLGMDQM